MTKTEIIIVGAGPAGLSQALILADAGLHVVLIDRMAVKPGRADNRTAALLRPAVDILRGVDVDPEKFPDTAPLRHLRLIDEGVGNHGGVHFSSTEIHHPYFALNIRNGDVHAALVKRVLSHPLVKVSAPCEIQSIDVSPYHVQMKTNTGVYQSMVVIGADGRESVVRHLAGITFHKIDYQQSAITCAITHTGAHHDTSIEFHRPGGPFTLVPLSGHRSSVVWMERSVDAEQILALSPIDFTARLQSETGNLLGDITVIDPPQCWPVIWQRADRMIAPRMALVAEAAHVLPPSGAQGLNMSLQDVQGLGSVFIRAHRLGLDIGSKAVLESFARLRMQDMHIKSNAVHGLNTIVMTAHPALRRLRRVGLMTASRMPFIRHMVMQFGWAGKL